MSRKIIIILVGIFCAFVSMAQTSGSIFVPHHPLTKQQRTKFKDKLINMYGFSERRAVEYLQNAASHIYIYTDFRKYFSRLDLKDKKVSICTNPMMANATRIVYLSTPIKHTVVVKSSMCKPVKGGLSCSPISVHTSYFFESPEQYFTLEDGVSYEKAIKLLTFLRGKTTGSQGPLFDYRNTTRISKHGDVYKVHLGDLVCGCTTTLSVTTGTSKNGKPIFKLSGDAMSHCV